MRAPQKRGTGHATRWTPPDLEWLEYHYVSQGKSTSQIGKEVKVGPGTVASWILSNPLHFRDFREVRSLQVGEKHPNWKGSLVGSGASRYRARILFEDLEVPEVCARCQTSKEKLLVHHLDGNELNNDLMNLQYLCKSCHEVIHKRFGVPKKKSFLQSYQVNEIYESIQGEGPFIGVPCTVVRMQGCPLKCSFCDSKSTWNPSGGTEMRMVEIFKKIETFHVRGRMILLTGGEPCIQNLGPLVQVLANLGPIHLETSGAFSIKDPRGYISQITISPKKGWSISPRTLRKADTIKWLIGSENDVAALCLWLQRYEDSWTFRKKISVQPISRDRKATAIAIAACLKYNWRLSIQMHKYIEVP